MSRVDPQRPSIDSTPFRHRSPVQAEGARRPVRRRHCGSGEPARQITSDIERSLSSAGDLLGDDLSRPRPFLFALVSARPALATAIADHVAANAGGRLASQTAIVLSALAAAGDPSRSRSPGDFSRPTAPAGHEFVPGHRGPTAVPAHDHAGTCALETRSSAGVRYNSIASATVSPCTASAASGSYFRTMLRTCSVAGDARVVYFDEEPPCFAARPVGGQVFPGQIRVDGREAAPPAEQGNRQFESFGRAHHPRAQPVHHWPQLGDELLVLLADLRQWPDLGRVDGAGHVGGPEDEPFRWQQPGQGVLRELGVGVRRDPEPRRAPGRS